MQKQNKNFLEVILNSIREAMSRTWRCNPRVDLDLFQRCFFIVSFTWFCNSVAETIFPPFLFFSLFWYLSYLGTIVGLVAGIAKSSLQYVPEGRAVLITSCEAGFGFHLAQYLTKIGFKVYAGCLKKGRGSGSKELESFSLTTDGRLKVVQLDVKVESQWIEVVEMIARECPNGLWGLVNNSVCSTFGEVEWVPIETYRKIMEVNVFGLLRGLQLCLPLIRKSKGRIVNISNGFARMAVPTRSPFVVSKYAVQGLLECLRYEMEAFGVKVSIIEHGSVGSSVSIVDQTADKMWSEMADEVRSAYGQEYYDERRQIMKSYMTTGVTDLEPIIKSYTNGLLDIFPQKRYQPMSLYYKIRILVATHLPEIFYDSIYVPYVKRG